MENKPKARKRSRGNGEGTIYQNEKTKKWTAQYTINIDDGQQKRKSFYGDTRKSVKVKMENFITELKTKTYVDKSLVTIEQLVSESIEDEHKMNILSDSSYLRKKSTLEQIKKHIIASKPIQEITERDIKNFFISITNYSNSVISKNYNMLSSAFKRAVILYIINRNPLDDVRAFVKPKSAKPTKKVTAFTIAEQKQFLDVLKANPQTNYSLQLLIAIYTGLRIGEINALTLDDIDIEKQLIQVNKTITRDINDKSIMGETTKTYAGIREAYINDYLLMLISKYIDNHYIENDLKLVFYDTKKTFLTASQVNLQFKRICEKYNISKGYDVNQHMLRHTFATRCIEADVPAKVLQKMLGHADVKTTLDTYCDVFEQFQQKHADSTIEYLKQNNLL